MGKRGRYYLGRVIKLGTLDQGRLMDAIVNAATLTIGKFRWTIINVTDRRTADPAFVFGHLAKFSAEGHVTVVDTHARALVDALAPNLLVASAPFVYLPEFSGIAYLHVWNGIPYVCLATSLIGAGTCFVTVYRAQQVVNEIIIQKGAEP
jgi:hypothetical protein